MSLFLQLYSITSRTIVLFLSCYPVHISACPLLPPLCFGALIGWCVNTVKGGKSFHFLGPRVSGNGELNWINPC